MEELAVSIKRLPGNDDVPLPRYMTGGSSGMDIFAAVAEETIILPGERKLVPTGIVIELPPGFEAQIRPRSGLAIRDGVTTLNSPGTIDGDYRGEIKIILINHDRNPFVIRRGDRIAQMVVNRICRVTWDVKEELEQTERNTGGFGHTG